MAISIRFTPTKSDIIRAGYLGLRARPVTLWSWVGFFVILPWTVGLGSLIAYLAGSPISLSSIVVLLLVPVFAIVFFSLIPLAVTRGARSLEGTHLYEFSEERIRLTGPGFDSRVEWSLLTRCYGFKLGLLFVSGNAPVITIPSRALPPETRAELRELLGARGVELAGEWGKKFSV